LLPRELSGILGLIGGVIDIAVGWVFLQQKPEMGMSMMVGSATAVGYFLLALGAAVFLTGVYVLSVRMMKRVTVGLLMIVFGVIMLALGMGMIGGSINLMQQGFSTISGIVMIFLGLSMLYSGYDMART
jgi:hypothetical protein